MHKKWKWILFAGFTLVLNQILSLYPDFTEKIYSHGIFLGIRLVYDYTLGWIPIPMLYMLFFCLIVIAVLRWIKLRKQKLTFKPMMAKLAMGLGNFLSIVLVVFYFSWGFNYNRPTLKEKLDLKINPLTIDELKAELMRMTAILVDTRNEMGSDSIPLSKSLLPNEFESIIRSSVESSLIGMNYKVRGRVRSRLIRPKGLLLRFSTAGIYIPHTFEGHVDAGMHPIQWPAAMAHEMTHAYGLTDEGECNFMAFVALNNVENPFLRYSGQLMYWRYLVRSFQRTQDPTFDQFWLQIPANIKADLREIHIFQDRYPDLIPQIRNAIYNQYLKSHGVQSGLLSYSQIVLLVHAWLQSPYSTMESPE